MIGMHIRFTGFLKASTPEVVFDINKKTLKRLIIIEKICVKLIFDRCVGLDWVDYCKLEATYTTNYEHNMIEVEKEDLKAKAKQLRNKKQ